MFLALSRRQRAPVPAPVVRRSNTICLDQNSSLEVQAVGQQKEKAVAHSVALPGGCPFLLALETAASGPPQAQLQPPLCTVSSGTECPPVALPATLPCLFCGMCKF